MRNFCMCGENGLKNYQGGDLMPRSPLKRVIRISETLINLSDHQSAPVWAFCMTFEWLGRSLGHSVGHLTAQMATRYLRLVAWTRSGPVGLFHSVGSSQSCRCTWASSMGQLGCVTASGSQGALSLLDVLGSSLGCWLLGKASSCLGLPSLTGWTHLGGCPAARGWKLGVSTPLSSPVSTGEGSPGTGALCQVRCCFLGGGPFRQSWLQGDFWDSISFCFTFVSVNSLNVYAMKIINNSLEHSYKTEKT